ncbi:hypothetical protein KQX54_003540 [Cotesia glomerata]|uniref:Uncharacterized protein n=1 Tax=Cotesia glomerata TaxID=32391 RepID=A0AAV7I7X1_COTGL|nr:hypothetical protein KQX54_003540 [Cotesia glomerata]
MMETLIKLRIAACLLTAILMIMFLTSICSIYLKARSKAAKLNNIKIIKLHWIEKMKVFVSQTEHLLFGSEGFQVSEYKRKLDDYVIPKVEAFFDFEDGDGSKKVVREMIQILIDYTKNYNNDYKNCVADFIKAVNNQVIKEKKTFTEPVSSTTQSIWLSYSLLLIFYEYSVEAELPADFNSNNSICHSLIVKIIPKLNFFFGKINSPTPTINTLRLLTNYLYDETEFSKDMTDKDALKPLVEEFKISSLSVKFYNALGGLIVTGNF